MKKSYINFLCTSILILSSGSFAAEVDVKIEKVQPDKQKSRVEDRMSSAKKWGWRIAKVAGAVALVGLFAYNIFATPTVKRENFSLIPEEVSSPESVTDVPAVSLLSPENKSQPLTKEQVRRYKILRNELGLSAAAMSGLALAGWVHPLFAVPIFMYGMGSAYFHKKTLFMNNLSGQG